LAILDEGDKVSGLENLLDVEEVVEGTSSKDVIMHIRVDPIGGT